MELELPYSDLLIQIILKQTFCFNQSSKDCIMKKNFKIQFYSTITTSNETISV